MSIRHRHMLDQIRLRLKIAAAALSGKPIVANCTFTGRVSLGAMPSGLIVANNTIVDTAGC